MVIPLALLTTAILGGTLLTYWFDPDAKLQSRLAAGISIGLTLFAGVGFLLANLFGLGLLTLALTAATMAAPLALLWRADIRIHVRQEAAAFKQGSYVPQIIGWTVVAALFGLVFDRVLFEKADGLYTGLSNNYSDLPLHLQIIASFAQGQNFPPQDPTFTGIRFAYPFLADFLSAMLVQAGATFRQSMFLPNLLLAMALAAGLHRWAWELTRDRGAAVLAPVLLLLNGGLGWLLLFRDLQQSNRGVLATLWRLPIDYSIRPDHVLRWGNTLTTLLTTQRSLLLGACLALVVFTQWWLALNGDAAAHTARRRMIAAGVVAGLLPLVHSHTFLVAMGLAGCLALLFRTWRLWTAFFLPAVVIALPGMLWLSTAAVDQGPAFVAVQFGWDHGKHNVAWFWLVNTGLFIPLLIVALWQRTVREDGRRLLFYLPFALCFVVPNVIRLAPWIWDNIKVMFYWHVASVPFLALLLARLFRGSWARRAFAGAALASLILAGSLDLWRSVSRTTVYREFDRDAMEIAEIVQVRAAPGALILHAPVSHSPMYLTGRRSVLGYLGHIASRGLDAGSRATDIRRIYAGGRQALELITHYDVDFVLVGPDEQRFTPVNEPFFSVYPLVGQAGAYRLYKTSAP